MGDKLETEIPSAEYVCSLDLKCFFFVCFIVLCFIYLFGTQTLPPHHNAKVMYKIYNGIFKTMKMVL